MWDYGTHRIHIDRAQFTAEQHGKTPFRERGWQDALQSVYPFKINRLAITTATSLTWTGPQANRCILRNLILSAITSAIFTNPRIDYPSRFWGQMVVFDKGRLSLDGRANYLMKPFPGWWRTTCLTGAPLNAVTPAARHINLTIKGGTLSSEGTVEDSPKVTNVDVRNATIESADLTYVHLRHTQNAEKQRITKAGKTIEKQNNRPAVYHQAA